MTVNKSILHILSFGSVMSLTSCALNGAAQPQQHAVARVSVVQAPSASDVGRCMPFRTEIPPGEVLLHCVADEQGRLDECYSPDPEANASLIEWAHCLAPLLRVESNRAGRVEVPFRWSEPSENERSR